MSNHLILSITFAIYIAIIFAIGIISYFQTKNLSDYMLGGRSLSAPIVALGAGASDMGSWLLLALPGAVMLHGMNQIWLPIGLAIGAGLNWYIVAKRLRVYTEVAKDSITIPAYFENRFHDNKGLLRSITAIVILVFFTLYTASGLVAGGMLFSSMFDVSYHSGLLITGIIIFTYTCIGGFLAISFIDFFQGSLMLMALLVIPAVVYGHFDGVSNIIANIQHRDLTGFLDFSSGVSILSIISLAAWGLGYFGQPHIIVRFMAIKNPKKTPTAMVICMTWMILALIGAVCIGILGAAYYQDGLKNTESVFIVLSNAFFNPWIEGILLAAVLSAIMSTSSAQLLASSSAVVEDVYLKFIRKDAQNKEILFVSRLVVLSIAIVAILLAYNPKSTILGLVSYAWAGLGASFGPAILFSLLWKRMNKVGASFGILVGALTVIIWPLFKDLGGIFAIYEIIPGFIFASIAIIVTSILTAKPSDEIKGEFEQFEKIMNS